MTGRTILVAGDVMLDEYVWGDVNRISPEAPVPVVEVHHRTYSLGGAANVAANIASLGGRPLLLGLIGRDEPADILQTALRTRGIETTGLQVDDSRPTTLKTRIVAQNRQVARLDCEDRSNPTTDLENRMVAWLAERLPEADACVISDYSKGAVSPKLAERLIEFASQAKKPVVVDPKARDFRRYRGATVITPNLLEARLAAGCEDGEELPLGQLAMRLIRRVGSTALLITRGPAGMSLYRRGMRPLHIPATARAVFDVTGAGDTVVGTLALAIGAGQPLEQAAMLANRAAGIVVGKLGTACVALEELLEDEKTGPAHPVEQAPRLLETGTCN